jgi:hypothetical protein
MVATRGSANTVYRIYCMQHMPFQAESWGVLEIIVKLLAHFRLLSTQSGHPLVRMGFAIK